MKNEFPELVRMSRRLDEVDPDVAEALRDEVRRQATGLELIASENFVSEAVLEAMGSVFTNKYAEGYPGKRYYGGCENVDRVERLAIERAKQLFGAEHANVQSHSGTQANISVYMTVLEPGATVLAHESRTRRSPDARPSPNFRQDLQVRRVWRKRKKRKQLITTKSPRSLREHQPKMIVPAPAPTPASLISLRIADIAQSRGRAFLRGHGPHRRTRRTGVHPSPVPYADFVSTTTHKTLRGPRGGLVLCREKFA